MVKSSTRLKFAAICCLLACFIVIQYSWLNLARKTKLEAVRFQLTKGFDLVVQSNEFKEPGIRTERTILDKLLRESFSSRGLNDVRFEFSLGASTAHPVASPGFRQSLVDNPNSLTLNYVIEKNNSAQASDDLLVLVIPSWRRIIRDDMAWMIGGSLLLTLLLTGIFYGAYRLVSRRQRLYNDRTRDIEKMVQQLETPLSTVSIAAQALANAKVMNDTAQISYYQQVINNEVQRMNEEVNKLRTSVEEENE